MDFLDQFPLPRLSTRLLWEAVVDIDTPMVLGAGPYGPRGFVGILGGSFRGGPGMEGFHGTIPPGGADRQLTRADGGRELDALYEMQVADGALLSVRNRVIIDETGPGPRYALSRIHVTPPEGPWAWLGRRVILGTLQSARPDRAAVIIRAWLAEAEMP